MKVHPRRLGLSECFIIGYLIAQKPVLASMRERFFSRARRLVTTTDAFLQQISGVTEFEADLNGLLRIKQDHADRNLTLRHGIRVERGALIMDLHLWNEHLPPFPSGTADFDWTSFVEKQIQASLHRLAVYIHARQELDKVHALRVRLSVAKHGPPTVLARLFMRAGFELIESPASGIGFFMPFIEGIWVWLLTWTYNPRALINWRFNRVRREFWISRSRFFARYAAWGDCGG